MDPRTTASIQQLMADGESGLTELIETSDDEAVRAICLLERAQHRATCARTLGHNVPLLEAVVSDYEAAIVAARNADHRLVCFEAMVNRPLVLQSLGRHSDVRVAASAALDFIRNGDAKEQAARHHLLCMRGTAAYFSGDYAAAAADYQAALELEPGTLGVASDLGEALLELEQYDDAIAAFDRAIAAGAATELTFTGRGMANERLANLSAARSDYRHALELDPDNPAARAGLSRLG